MAVLCLNFSTKAQVVREKDVSPRQEELKPLKVGDKLPEAFWQQEHTIYAKGQTDRQTLEKYKGKLLILKFWASWCSTCIGKFPLVDSLNHLEDIHVAMVASKQSKDSLQTVAKVLQQHRVAQKYPLASIIDDGTLSAMFPYKYVPQYVWIDYTGRILAITNYYFFTADKVNEVLASQRRMAGRVKAKP